MSLDTRETIRDFTNAVIYKPIGRAMANPLTLALLITTIIMLIIVLTYDREHLVRTSLYVFFVSVLLLFMNNHILLNDVYGRQLNTDQQNVLGALESRAPNRQIITPERVPLSNQSAPNVIRVAGGTQTQIAQTNASPYIEQQELPDAASVVVPA